jgi:hypothetical protein
MCAISAAAAGACAAPSDDASSAEAADRTGAVHVQMNDVSVLYPLPKSKAEADGLVAASAGGLGGALLPAKLYTDATGQPKTRPSTPPPPGSGAPMPWDELRAVAFRIDPCFANIGPITQPETCRNQLRIVFQSITTGSGTSAGAATAVDGAVHAFYALDRAELLGLVKDIAQLRQAQDPSLASGPLAIHPILAAQGLLGGEAQGLRALLLKHAGTKNLVQFTKFTPGNLNTRWDFAGFTVKDGHFTPMDIPTLAPHTTDVSFFAGFGIEFEGGFIPETTAADDMQLLGNVAKAQQATPAAQHAAVDAALRILNPNKHSPETIDCASCHVSGPGLASTASKLGIDTTGNPNGFVPDGAFISAAEMKQSYTNAQDPTNFHMFSYRFASPMIGMRVINETASVVTLLNGQLLH